MIMPSCMIWEWSPCASLDLIICTKRCMINVTNFLVWLVTYNTLQNISQYSLRLLDSTVAQKKNTDLSSVTKKAHCIEIALPEMLSYSPLKGLGCPLLPMQKLWVKIAFIEYGTFHAVHQCSGRFLTSSYALHSSSGNTGMSGYDDLVNALVYLLYFLFLFSMNGRKRAHCEERKGLRINFKQSHTKLLNSDMFCWSAIR